MSHVPIFIRSKQQGAGCSFATKSGSLSRSTSTLIFSSFTFKASVILISLKGNWLTTFLSSMLMLYLIFNESTQTTFLVQQPFLFHVVLLFPFVLLVVLLILWLISSSLGYRSLIIVTSK